MYRSVKRVPVYSSFLLNGEIVGICRDVSVRGAFVESQLRPEIGSCHAVEMTFDRRVFRCDARVVRHADNGFAVEFEDVVSKIDRDLEDLLGPDAQDSQPF